jgi:hypothetical protein
MFYYIKARTSGKSGYYTGSTVSKLKSAAQNYASIHAVHTAYRALQTAGRTVRPLTIGHSL